MSILNRKRSAILLRLETLWRTHPWPFIWLVPLSWLFRSVVVARFYAYQWGLLKRFKSSVPIWVVGNLSVGGSGKTPVVIALVDFLRSHGLRVGIVSHGYARHRPHKTVLVEMHHKACEVGDEAKLIALKTGCPVAVSSQRVEAVKLLLQHHHLDIILSDDGLSHYALMRDLELICQHMCPHHANHNLVPAGPYRDHKARGLTPKLQCSIGHDTRASLGPLYCLEDPDTSLDWSILANKTVVVIAGIAKPERFYAMLSEVGIQFTTVPLSDHGVLSKEQLHTLSKTSILLMTEKDAVKYDAEVFHHPCFVVRYTLNFFLIPLNSVSKHFYPIIKN